MTQRIKRRNLKRKNAKSLFEIHNVLLKRGIPVDHHLKVFAQKERTTLGHLKPFPSMVLGHLKPFSSMVLGHLKTFSGMVLGHLKP